MNEDDLRKGDVQAALDELGRRAHVEYLGQNAGTPVALVPEDFRVQSLKPLLDEYLPRPERRKGTVVLTHTILGDTMDKEQLYTCVTAIARVGDDLDDKIVAMFGGKTALGKLSAPQPLIEVWE